MVHHEILEPGRRSSAPHVHSHKEEMVVVLEGTATVHMGSESIDLIPGDFLGFEPGQGLSHYMENKTHQLVKFLVIASPSPFDRVEYSS